MKQKIKNIILIKLAVLYLGISTYSLVISISPNSFYTSHIISSTSSSKSSPPGTKAWIQRKHIPLTVKFHFTSAAEVINFLFSKPPVHSCTLLTGPVPKFSSTFLLTPKNKAPPRYILV